VTWQNAGLIENLIDEAKSVRGFSMQPADAGS
jgi:hypothetical protein